MSKKSKKYTRKSVQPHNSGVIPAANQQQVIHQEQKVYSGPIPPPDTLNQYNEIVPGAAERILCMAEDNASIDTTWNMRPSLNRSKQIKEDISK